MPLPSGRRRFGNFAFDPASGELVGAGAVTRLTPQVAALLEELLEHAGTVVTRAELQARLWPDTTVEFDDGLNFCVRQLRVALGDDANAPTYIETLPRRGYRFLPAVTIDARGAVPASVDAQAAAPSTGQRRLNWWIAFPLLVLAIAAGTFAFLRFNRSLDSTAPRVVLGVLPFAADTTDPMMATYRRRLFDQLTKDASAEPGWDFIPPPATAATHVLSGSLKRDGNSVKLFVELVEAGSQRKLWADDLTDMYAFSGNSTMTADRIEKSVARILAPASNPAK